MASHAAFLRGINVGGHRVQSEQLRSCLEANGLGEVATFRASGNVVFEADGGGDGKLASRIENALEAELGYAVPTFVRKGSEVVEIAGRTPFDPERVEASKGKLQVLLLPRKPTAKARKQALALASDQDPLALEGSELYWLPSGGTRDSELDTKELERLLGTGTQRTAGTISQIAAKFFGA